ncbi:MAG: hypothetical protein A3J24_11425 [Deltaproteobacteria bacterium RIFCSPLOWO2_02_FULL_53_8]|nr:MAG: hypothetical protein A3J24_11425 [Deltaproteobacteria bacterium RIFCSPLOWO2_02_FULL_53_8]
MAKIILSMGDKVLQVLSISKERITIGRRPHNDVVIDDIAISAVHAVIVTTGGESVLEDSNSTNGTQVNGQPVKKHFLQNQDVIELAKYNLSYMADVNSDDAHAATSMMDCASRNACDDMLSTATTIGPQHDPVIEVLNGASAGRRIGLTKVFTTLGRPGLQVAVITRRAEGYCIAHVEGRAHPIINGESIGVDSYMMAHGDVIDLAGTQMVFHISVGVNAKASLLK